MVDHANCILIKQGDKHGRVGRQPTSKVRRKKDRGGGRVGEERAGTSTYLGR